jgi:hypothetical protein
LHYPSEGSTNSYTDHDLSPSLHLGGSDGVGSGG